MTLTTNSNATLQPLLWFSSPTSSLRVSSDLTTLQDTSSATYLPPSRLSSLTSTWGPWPKPPLQLIYPQPNAPPACQAYMLLAPWWLSMTNLVTTIYQSLGCAAVCRMGWGSYFFNVVSHFKLRLL
jgi:hypothetical protein